MAKFIIIGVAGEDNLWLINTDNKTVQDLDPSAIDNEGAAEVSYMQIVQNMRKDGQIVLKNVNVAIAINDRSEARGETYSTDPRK